MLVARLAVKNLALNIRRTLLVGSLITICVLVAIAGNSLFVSAVEGLRRTFINCFTGDLFVSAHSEDPMSLFGADTPVIGSYVPIPVLPFHERILEQIEASAGVDAAVSQVSGYALLEMADARNPVVLFGVDGDRYFKAFPAINIVGGSPLSIGKPGTIISSKMTETIGRITGRLPALGDIIRLSVFTDRGFTIREVPLIGTFEYPVSNTVLDRIVYVDVDTLRTLNGMVRGASLQAADGLQGNLDNVFDSPGIETPTGEAISLGDVQRILSDSGSRDAGLSVEEGSWNFILIKLKPGINVSSFRADLERQLALAGLQATVGDWRSAAGSGAALAGSLSGIFNVGLALLAFVVVLILANTLFIWVTQREGEIATMRALGAGKGFVFRLFMAESIILSLVAGAIGAAAGSLLVSWLHHRGLPTDNRILTLIFGGTLLRPLLTPGMLMASLLGALAVGVLAVLLPIRLALRVQPAQAVNGQQQ